MIPAVQFTLFTIYPFLKQSSIFYIFYSCVIDILVLFCYYNCIKDAADNGQLLRYLSQKVTYDFGEKRSLFCVYVFYQKDNYNHQDC